MSILSLFKKSKKTNTQPEQPKPKKNTYVRVVAERMGVPYEEALALMNHARDEYDIPYLKFAQQRMENFSDERLANFSARTTKMRENAFNKLIAVTGWTEEHARAELDRIHDKFGIGVIPYFNSQYFLKTDEEIEATLAEQKRDKEARMERLMEKSGWDRKKLTKHMKECRARYGVDDIEYDLFKAWECSFEELDTFSTILTSKALSRKYNNGIVKVTSNKVLFNQVFKDYINRKFWVNDPDATYESFLEFLEGLDVLFCKPINLMQGRGTRKIYLSEWDTKELYDFFMNQPQLLIEECVQQHHEMNALYDNSVNTVRLVTVRYKGEIKILCSFIRIGLNGSIVDNMLGGGTIAGVDEVTGEIITGAVDKEGNVYDVHPNTGAQIRGFKIPNFDLACELAIKCMDVHEGAGYIGWDIAICEDKAVIIEGNTLPGLASYQIPFCQDPVKKGMLYKFEEYM